MSALPTPYYDDPVSGITLYCGDCIDVLPHLPAESIDLVLTDPPYNVSEINGRDGTTIGTIKRRDGSNRAILLDFGAWDRDYSPDLLLTEAARVLRDRGGFLAFTGDRLVGAYVGGPLRHLRALVWHKTNPAPNFRRSYQPSIEFVIWKGKNGPALFTGDGATSCVFIGPIVPPHERVHPTQKPLWLLRRLLVLHSAQQQMILDPYAGSGTTLRAAKDLGRRAIGIEQDERYCAIAVERLRQGVLPLEMPA